LISIIPAPFLWDIPAYSVHYFIYHYRFFRFMSLSKGKLIAIIAVVAVIVIVLGSALWYVGTYNKMVKENESIDNLWAQVTNEYQRKIDLIPALVTTVSGYQQFEASTLTNITELRTQWMNANGSTDEQVNISNRLDTQLKTILVTYENYPTLQSIYAVSSLMTSLEGTENRITVARMNYNDAVMTYNAHVRSFPASWVADNGGFGKREYYNSPNAPAAP
jgi:LemA protein